MPQYKRSVSYASYKKMTKPAKTLANKVKKIEKKLNKEEVKFFDYSQLNQNPGATAVIYPLTGVVQNDGYNNREGNRITSRSLLFRLNAIKDNVPAATAMRAMIVQDKECAAATPNTADILENAGNYLSPLNHVGGKRFKVLHDCYITLTASNNMKTVQKFIKLKDTVIRYQDQFGTTPRENNLFLILISDNAVNPPGCDFYSRLRFTDA